MLGSAISSTATVFASEIKSSQRTPVLTVEEINAIKLEYSDIKENSIQPRGGSITTKIVKKYGNSIASKVPGKAGVWLGKMVLKLLKARLC